MNEDLNFIETTVWIKKDLLKFLHELSTSYNLSITSLINAVLIENLLLHETVINYKIPKHEQK